MNECVICGETLGFGGGDTMCPSCEQAVCGSCVGETGNCKHCEELFNRTKEEL